jgi:hypothetical protein
MTTPTLVVGGRKTSALLNIAPGGSLNLSNGGSNRTTLSVAGNINTDTGTTPSATMDMTGGSFIAKLAQVTVANRQGGGATGKATGVFNFGADPNTNVDILVSAGNAMRVGLLTYAGATQPTGETSTGTVTIGGGTVTVTAADATAVILGNFSATSTITGAAAVNAATGTWNITGGNVTVNSAGVSPAIAMALRSVTASTVGANTSTGNLNVSGGSLTVNNAIAGNSAPGQQTSNLSLTGGLLNMQGKNISGITNLTFTGGTLRDLGLLNQPLTQNGPAALLDVLNNDTIILGAYTLTDGTAQVALGRALRATSATIADTLVENLGFTAGPSLLVLTGALDLTAATDALTINADPALFNGTSTYTLATYASLAADAHFDSVNYFDGSTTTTGTDAQATTAGGLFPNNYALQYQGTSLILAPVPEPATVSLLGISALTLFTRRRRPSQRSS